MQVRAEVPFAGGWFLYLGYELAAEIEPTLALMNRTLEALAAFDSADERTREPAVIFRP